MTLKVVEPIEVTEAVLAASDIPEPDTAQGEVEWSPNRNGASYTIGNNPTAIASSGTVDYVISFSASATMDEYTNGVLTHSQALSSIEFIPSDAHFYDGFVYIADLTKIKYYNIITKAEGEAVVSGGVEAGTVFTSITSVLDAFYLYDRGNKKVKEYTLSGNTLTFTRDIVADIGDNYPKLTIADSGGFFVLNNGTVYTYSDEFNLISEKKTPRLVYQQSVHGGIVNDGNEVRGISTISSSVESYDYSLEYKGLYLPGDRVIKTSTHQVYQCLTATSQDPEEGATEDAAATWIVVGPTNKWAMFDNLQNTKTINDTDFTVTLNPVTYVNTLAALGFSGVSSVRVEVDDTGGSTIYDKTFTASDFSAIYDHYTYVFYQIVALKKMIVEDLPPLPNTTIRVTFSGADMQIGELAFGFAVNIGTLVANGTKSDRFRYREQQYNEFGYPTGAAPIVVELNTYDVLVPKLTNPSIQKLLDGLTGKNTLWVGDIGSDQRMITYGFFERSPIPFNMPNDINYQITVRASV